MRFESRFIFGKLLLAAVVATVLGAAVMLLWNTVVPTAFTGARPIDFPHALGLLVLSRILFGGFGGARRGRGWRRRRGESCAMTAEERQRVKESLVASRPRDETESPSTR